MNLALILGLQGEKVKPKLRDIKDNLKIDCYMDVPAFIDTTMKRDLVYDRVVILRTVVNEVAVRDLVKFWKKFCMDTEVVFLCRLEKDEDFAKMVQNSFVSTKVASMLIKATTLKIFSESVLLPVDSITKKYGIEDYLAVEAEVDSGVQYYQPDAEESGGIEYVPEPEAPKVQQKPKKKGLFGGLFGGKKNKKQKEVVEEEDEDESEEYEEEDEEDSSEYDGDSTEYEDDSSEYEEDDSSGYEDDEQEYEDTQSEYEESSDETKDASYNEETASYENDSAPEPEEDPYEALSAVENERPQLGSVGRRVGVSTPVQQADFSATQELQEPEYIGEEPESTPAPVNVGRQVGAPVQIPRRTVGTPQKIKANTGFDAPKPKAPQNAPQRTPRQNVQEVDITDDMGFGSMYEEDTPEPTIPRRVPQSQNKPVSRNSKINGTTPSPANSSVRYTEESSDFDEGVDVDFGEDTFTGVGHVSSTIQTPKKRIEVEDEEQILSSIESQYRDMGTQQNQGKKNLKVSIGGSNALNNVYSGRSHKTIIVTGDRGAGSTVTAFSIAKEFAKKVNVLYVDFDIERHGLLSYIDYEFFRTFDESMTDGIKRCRESSIFMNCIIRYDTNIDIITSDYSCDATDEDIQLTHNVVAENVMNYGVVIVDCPISKLHLIQDLIFIGTTVVCMESSKRGVMNMLCGLEGSPLELRYKRCIVHKGVLFATKLNKRTSTKKVLQYADSIFASSGCDWLRMECEDFNGTLTKEILNKIVEG